MDSSAFTFSSMARCLRAMGKYKECIDCGICINMFCVRLAKFSLKLSVIGVLNKVNNSPHTLADIVFIFSLSIVFV